jgi:peroxiredoxin
VTARVKMTRRTILVVAAAEALTSMLPILDADATVAAAPRNAHPDAAPDFALTALDGRTVRLSSFRGRLVLLNFWATWCAACQIETPWLVDIAIRYRAQGLDVIAVSMDEGDSAAVRTFATEHHMTYPVLLGTAAVADAYGGVRFVPQTVFIGRDGRIIDRTLGLATRQDLENSVRRALAVR